MVLTGRVASADVGLQTIRVTGPGLDRTIEPGTGGGVYTTLFGERAIGPGTAIITVSTSVTGHNATIEYLDAADEPITDTNTMIEALEMSAARGLNTIKVKGTAEDTATTQIQTLRIVRAAAAPPKDATAEYTGNITVAEPSGFKGFNSIGRWSGAITHHRIETMRVDGVKPRIRAVIVTDSEVRLARERIDADRVAVCFAASVRSRPPVRFEIDGKSFDIADARDVPGSEKCYSWARPAGMSWSLGDIVLVKAFDSRNQVATGALRIIGEPVIGNTLTVDTTGVSDRDGIGTWEYEWLLWDGDFAGTIEDAANMTSYELTRTSELGLGIQVTASFTNGAGYEERVESQIVTVRAASYGRAAKRAHEEEIWSATLTPKDLGSSEVGCKPGVGTDKTCTTTTVLTDDDFPFAGGTYSVTALYSQA